MQRTAKRIAVLSLVHVLGVAGLFTRFAPADDWQTIGHDPQYTGLSSSTLDPTSLTYTWTAPQGFYEPLTAANALFAISNGINAKSTTTIDSFNLATGSVNWSTSAVYDGSSQMAYGAGMLAYTASVNQNSMVMNSLHVLDAVTGTPLYSTSLVDGGGDVLTIAKDTTTNQQVAYVSDGRGSLTAVRLGSSSGTVLWTATGLLSGNAPPSVAGNLLLTASVDQYYAIDRTTGAVIKIYNGPLNGGSGYTPVVDTVRSQFYILGGYGATGVSTLTAYSYNGSTITQLWQRTGSGVGTGNVALDANGNIYCADSSKLLKLDPATGNILASLSGSFATGNTPILSNGYLWLYGSEGALFQPNTLVYRLSDFSQVASIATPAISEYPVAAGIGAVVDSNFIQNYYNNNAEAQQFQVFTGVQTPEPASISLLLIGGSVLRRRSRQGERVTSKE